MTMLGACTNQSTEEAPQVEVKTDTVEQKQDFVAETPAMFASVEAVCYMQEQLIQENLEDQIFRSIPQQELAAVAKIILLRNGYITKKSVVEEYMSKRHQNTYQQFLDSMPEKTQEVPTKEETPVIDTTIDGKHYQLIQ